MTQPSDHLPDVQIDTSLTSPQGCAAAQRALDYYLKPAAAEETGEVRFFDVNKNVSGEEALVHATDLLRCAGATAYEAAKQLQGSSRDLALSVVHMIDMARAMVDRALERHQSV